MVLIQQVEQLEFAFEYWLSYSKWSNNTILEMLILMEGVKSALKFKNLIKSIQNNTNPYQVKPREDKLMKIEEQDENEENQEENEEIQDQKEKDINIIQQKIQQLKQILNSLKENNYLKSQNTIQYFEKFKINSQKIPIINLFNFQQIYNIQYQLTNLQFTGEVLFILRPFVYCILLRIYGLQSYLPYKFNILVDILRIYCQQNNLQNHLLKQEYQLRNQSLLINYLLRHPVQEKFIQFIVEPLMKKFIRFDMLITWIRYLIQIRCYNSRLI